MTAAITLTALAAGAAGCGSPAMPGGHASASARPAPVSTGTVPTATPSTTTIPPAAAMAADVYVQVLRRYLSTPAENSFSQAFKTVYVLNRAYPDAANPSGPHARGVPIAPQAQRQVTAALAAMAHVTFIADRGSVIEAKGGCGQVKNGGILITLGPPAARGNGARVAINGWVACLGATWLTYVLRDEPGTGWRVTGTTGSMAIA